MSPTTSPAQARHSGGCNNSPADTDRRQKSRSRASVACETCRERRTKCVISQGASECTQCRNLGCACVVKHDDERRKPNSKAYVNSLNEKVVALEAALAERNQRLNLANDHPRAPPAATPEPPAPPADGRTRDAFPARELNADGEEAAHFGIVNIPSLQSNNGARHRSMLRKLLSHSCHTSFDRWSGQRLRTFGPAASCHVFLEPDFPSEETRKLALEEYRRAQRVISSIPTETHDYLLQLFWDFDNTVIPLVHKPAFEEGRRNGDGPLYSGFLHLCILAVGARYADKARPDISKICISQYESIFHLEAKFMVDHECDRLTSLPSIAALLLLGDLEGGAGRDSMGWLYTGMAGRLCFDMGLQIDRADSNILAGEFQAGRMTLLACAMYDKYWALLLGRPTVFDQGSATFRLSEAAGLCNEMQTGTNAEVYEALIDLLEISGKITRLVDQDWKLVSDAAPYNYLYTRMAGLSRELDSWYIRLPGSLKWTAENIQKSPPSFFLLHQQYHANVIMLHLPFAKSAGDMAFPEPLEDSDDEYGPQSNAHVGFTYRAICTQHAMRVIRAFSKHERRFGRGKTFSMSLQQIGVAAVALITIIALSGAPRAVNTANMGYLECATRILKDLSRTHALAGRMVAVLQTTTAELREQLSMSEEHTPIPTRRNGALDQHPEKVHRGKRRRISENVESEEMPAHHRSDVPMVDQQEALVNDKSPLAMQSRNTSSAAFLGAGSSSFMQSDGCLARPPTGASNVDGAELLLRSAESLSTLDRGQPAPSFPNQRPTSRGVRDSGDVSSGRSPNIRSQVLDGLHSQHLFPNLNGLDFLSVLSGIKEGGGEVTRNTN